MGLNLMNSASLYAAIASHVGHDLEVVGYGDGDNYAIECVTCGEVLLDVDRAALPLPLGDGRECPHCGAHYEENGGGFALSWSGQEWGRAWVERDEDGIPSVSAKSSADDSQLDSPTPFSCINCGGLIVLPEDLEVDWS
jgi:hypothetical protein